MSEADSVEFISDLPQDDGRQSLAALAIARGAGRVLHAHGYCRMAEFTLANGRRADLAALSPAGEIWIVEIKSSVIDYRSDQKWPEYRDYCDRFFFAVQSDFPRELIPEDVGLIVADRFGGEVVRSAPEHRLSSGRRKAILLQFARTAAIRLHALADPGIVLEKSVRE
ncbi:MAG: MmcB family DNA repair protein [Hyphomicrobiaceae bacterium]|nr:MmcB family DNA repair protein [Hyphomicrobiaceae bacterium]